MSIELFLKKLTNARNRYVIRKCIVKYLPKRFLQWLDENYGICFPKYFSQKKVIFIHVPKSAGTSVAQALYGRSVTHHTADFFRECNPKKFDEYFSFAIVRNPLDRLVSAYEYAKSGGTSRVPISNPEKYQVREFSTFKKFVMEWLPTQKKLDFVFRPQYEFVFDNAGNQLVDVIFDMENIRDVEESLRKNAEIEIEISKTNSSKHKSYKSYYDAETLKAVKSFYAKDFEAFTSEFNWECEI